MVLLAWKLRNTIDGSVQHIAASTEEVPEVLRLAKTDGTIVRDEILSIRTAKGSVILIRGPIHCLQSFL